MKKHNFTGMIFMIFSILVLLVGCSSKSTETTKGDENMKNTIVVLETSKGNIEIELYQDKAPISTKNFLDYVEKGHYDGLIFHRVMKGFMIQGGGFDKDMSEKATDGPIKNEAGNGIKNEKGTIAMARTMVVDSATSQFFINVADNAFLDHSDDTMRGFGYAVFGKVISGMDVVSQIESSATHSVGQFDDVPVEPIIIKKAYVKK